MKNHIRIAHLILVHKSPFQILRLARALVCPEMDCYIHVDAKVNIKDFIKILGNVPHVYFIRKRVNIQWAGYGTIQATINGFTEILQSHKEYDYLHVMSGQDYPVKKKSYILSYIQSNYGEEFFDFIHDRWPEDIATRYTKYHLINYKIPGKYRLGNFISTIFPERSFFFNGPVFGSSNWFMVTCACAQYLINTLNVNRSLVRYFKHVWGADEFIFINLLLHSPFKQQINGKGLHYMEWVKNSSHARVLTINDLNVITSGSKLFARKFDIDLDSKILDELDKMLLT